MPLDDDDTIEFEPVEQLPIDDEDTIEFEPGAGVLDQPPVAELYVEPGIEIAAATHCGLVRTTNEDQYAVIRRTRTAVVLGSTIADGQLLRSYEGHRDTIYVDAPCVARES